MYTPPHEFAINIPKVMADVRLTGYEQLSWPALLARAYSNRWVGAGLAAFAALVVIVSSILLVTPDRLYARHLGPGAFFAVIPSLAMAIPALALFAYAIGVWLRGCVRLWSGAGKVVKGPGTLDERGLTKADGKAAVWSFGTRHRVDRALFRVLGSGQK